MDDFQHLDDHALLGVSPGASPDEVKQAYRREITKYHPDRFRHADPQTQQYARERSQRLTEAYAGLSRNSRLRPSPIPRSRVEGMPTERGRGDVAQPMSGTQLAGWYEQATELLAAKEIDQALRLLRQIQRVDPFYRNVDELLAQAERMKRVQPQSPRAGRRSFAWAAAGVLGSLVVLGGAWGAGVFDRTPAASMASSPAAVVAELSSVVPTEILSGQLSPAPNPLSSAAPSGAERMPETGAGTAPTPPGAFEIDSASEPKVPTIDGLPSSQATPVAEVIATSPATPPTETMSPSPTVPPTATVAPATAAAAAPAPRATQAPAPARRAVAVESGRVLVADNFNNPSSGWPKLQTASYTLGYRNGAYAITTKPSAGTIFGFGAPLSQGDVVIGADVTPIRGSVGLLFGSDNSYRFFISNDGSYRVEQRGKVVASSTASKALRRGSNRLVIAAAGTRVSLYANGVLLTNLDLPSSLEGTTYGFVVSGGGGAGEGQFDTLTVRSLPR